MIDNARSNYIIENSLDSIKITIHGHRNWAMFLMTLFVWTIQAFCTLPILGLITVAAVQEYLVEELTILIGVLVLVLYLFITIVKFKEVLEFAIDTESIEIDNQIFRITKSGLGFKIKKEYHAENIRGISQLPSLISNNALNWLLHLSWVSKNMDAFMIWHTHGLRKFHTFGKGLASSDSQIVLETILRRFPQYRYSDFPR